MKFADSPLKQHHNGLKLAMLVAQTVLGDVAMPNYPDALQPELCYMSVELAF
jgi:hypothetical protein